MNNLSPAPTLYEDGEKFRRDKGRFNGILSLSFSTNLRETFSINIGSLDNSGINTPLKDLISEPLKDIPIEQAPKNNEKIKAT